MGNSDIKATDHSATFNLQWLRFAGLWPDPGWPRGWRVAYALVTVFLAVLHSTFPGSLVASLFLDPWDGIEPLLANINIISVGITNTVKFFPFLFSKDKIKHCIIALSEAEAPFNVPRGGIFTNDGPAGAHAADVRRLARRVSRWMIGGCYLVTVVWIWDIINTDETSYRGKASMRWRVWFPWSSWSLGARVLVTSSIFCIATSAVCTNAFYWTLMRVASQQFCALCEELEALHGKAVVVAAKKGVEGAWESFQQSMALGLAQAVQHHQAILRYVDFLHALLAPVVFSQCLGNMIMLCGIAVIAMSSTDVLGLALMCGFLIFELAELALFCSEGTVIIEQSEAVRDAAFACGWQDCTPPFKSALRFVLLRAQKPACITALGFSTLSLQLFASLLRASYSFYAVVRQEGD